MDYLEELLALTLIGVICHSGIIAYLCSILRQANRAKYPAMVAIMYLFLVSNVFAALYFLLYLAKCLAVSPKWLKLLRTVFAVTWTAASSSNLISHWLFAHNYWVFSLTLPQILEHNFPVINE